MKTIKKFNFSTENIPQNGQIRKFSIIADKFAVFSLEIKNDEDEYYNFETQKFSLTVSKLDYTTITTGRYDGTVVFPAVTTELNYDIRLWAPDIYDTKHADYVEVRNEDDTINLNASSGSNSNLLAKKIYQYVDITVTIKPNTGPSGTNWGAITAGTDVIKGNLLSTSSKKYSFSVTATVAGDKGITILRQPKISDIYAVTSRQYGTAAEISEEDLFEHIRIKSQTNGVGTGATDITLDSTCTALGLLVGDDVVIGNYTDKTLLITHLGTATEGLTDYQIRVNSSVTWGNDTEVIFYYKGYYRWNIHANSSLHGLSNGMLVSSGVEPHLIISPYSKRTKVDKKMEAQYEKMLEKMKYYSKKTGKPLPKVSIKDYIKTIDFPALEKSKILPTYTSGVISKQLGIITHNQQQFAAMANQTFKVFAYGRNKIKELTYCDAVFTNVEAELTTVTTLTNGTISSANLVVDDRSGVINNITRVKAIGIDGTSGYPLITAGAGSDGGGTLTMNSSQNIEDNQTVTFLGTGSVVTITGEVEFKRFPSENIDLNFDVSRFLLMN